MPALNKKTSFTWLGHAAFKVVSPKGKVLLIDPWVAGNPSCPENLKTFEKIDFMLVTHGHFDHIADAVPLAKAHKPKVIGIYETCHWLEGKGVDTCLGMNKGGTVEFDGIKITQVHADHSCGILDDDGKIIYGGEAVGYVVELENGFKFYHAGDTNVFGDMKIISELYQPELAMLPIGNLYTMSPREAGYACRLLNPKYVIPMHFGTFPPLTGTPDALKKELAGTSIQVLEMKPGETLE